MHRILLLGIVIAPFSALIYIIGLCLYRLSPWHPLSKYPGPFLAKITPYYALYHTLREENHLNIWRCHQKYGNFVRYSPDRLLVNTAAAVKDIYGYGKNLRKSSGYSMIPEFPGAYTTISVIDKIDHGRKRRLLSAGLSDTALRDYEVTMLERIRVFCKQLLSDEDGAAADPSPWSTAKNMSDWSNYLSFDIMAAVIFGKPFSMLEQKENRSLPRALDNAIYRAAVYTQLPHKPHATKKRLDRFLFPKDILLGAMKFFHLAASLTSERVEKMGEKDSGDILSNIIKAKDPETGKPFPTAEIHAESRMLILAGSDTSSTALAGAFFYLSHNKSAYDRLASEVRSAFSSADEICTGPALNGCAYLRACVDETMRMTPPLPGALFREVLRGGASIGGRFIPAGYDVGVCTYSLHHNPEYFPKPFEFRPERWLEEDGSKGLDRSKAAFFPFQLGPRGCIGKSMAYAELLLSIARVIYTCDFRSVGEVGERKVVWEGAEYVEFKTQDHMTSGKDGPLVEFKTRS